ncbi:hypothetical protein B1987_08035 [Mycobacterium kansasii]|nr:hypothetical protein B1987_08035 [Mycobacterium kansasii]
MVTEAALSRPKTQVDNMIRPRMADRSVAKLPAFRRGFSPPPVGFQPRLAGIENGGGCRLIDVASLPLKAQWP